MQASWGSFLKKRRGPWRLLLFPKERSGPNSVLYGSLHEADLHQGAITGLIILKSYCDLQVQLHILAALTPWVPWDRDSICPGHGVRFHKDELKKLLMTDTMPGVTEGLAYLI